MEFDDGLFFPSLEPMIAGNEQVVLVDFAVAIPPLVILRDGEFNPAQQAQRADFAACREPLDEVDEIVTDVVGNPVSA